jgi:ComF family protein
MIAQFSRNARSLRCAILDLLFPARCAICSQVGACFCDSCQSHIENINLPICARCGRPLEADECSGCLNYPIQIDGIRAFAFFQGVMRDAIHRFKYSGRAELASTFGTMLKQYLDVHPLPFDVIVPVPLYPAQEHARGYNQSLLLAHELASRVHVPVLASSVKRVRATHPQYNLNARARRQNVRGAFAADDRVAGMRVLVLDDVCTTGATMDECSIVLRNHGARSVWGLALARGK